MVLTIYADQKLAIEEGMQILASIDVIEPFVLVIGLASNLKWSYLKVGCKHCRDFFKLCLAKKKSSYIIQCSPIRVDAHINGRTNCAQG